MKNSVNRFLSVGLLISACTFGVLLSLDVLFLMIDFALSTLLFKIIVITILLAGTVLSAVGLGITLQNHERFLKNRPWVLPVFILDCVFAFLLMVGVLSNAEMVGTFVDSLFLVGFATSAVFTMIGYRQTRAVTADPALKDESLPARTYKRTLMFVGAILATVAFSLLSFFFFILFAGQYWITSPLQIVALGFTITATVFAALGIKISRADHVHYWTKRWTILVTFILCCSFGGLMFIVFFVTTNDLMLLGNFFVLACLATAAPLIMVDYVKAITEEKRPIIPQGFTDIAESIAKFDELRKRGVISQAEFDEIKTKHIEKIK